MSRGNYRDIEVKHGRMHSAIDNPQIADVEKRALMLMNKGRKSDCTAEGERVPAFAVTALSITKNGVCSDHTYEGPQEHQISGIGLWITVPDMPGTEE